jgi:hypothetical protein
MTTGHLQQAQHFFAAEVARGTEAAGETTPADCRPLQGVDVEGLELLGLDALPRLPDGTVVAAELTAFLAAVDPAGLPADFDVLELVAAWDKVSSWVSSRQLTAMAEFARRPDVVGADPELARASRLPVGRVAREHPDDEIGARLRVSSRSASLRLDLAVQLADGFSATGQALARGQLDVSKARVVVDECRRAEPGHLVALQERLLPRASTMTAPRLRAAAQRAVMSVDPEAGERRAAARRAEAAVVVTPAGDGVAELWAQLPAERAAAIEQVIDAAARRLRDRAGDGDVRSLDAWRAEALALPFVRALRTGVLDGEQRVRLGSRGRSAVRVNVSVPAAVLLGLSDAPAQLDGHGPIPASLARLMAEDATWRRILTDPAGNAVDVGTTRYRPGASTVQAVQLRHPRCVYPGCGAAAERCDLDHVVPWPHGPTSVSNLAPECRRHHRAKHRDDLRDCDARHQLLARSREQTPPPAARLTADGGVEWTLPTGHRYPVDLQPVSDPDVDHPLLRLLETEPACESSRAEAALSDLLAA